MQSRLWSIIIIILILGIGFPEESNAQEELYKFGEFVRLLGGKAIKIEIDGNWTKEDVQKLVDIKDNQRVSVNSVSGKDIMEESTIKLDRILHCQPGYNFALKTKGDEVWLNNDTQVQVKEKDRNKGNIIIMEGEICADELNETVFQLEIGQTTVFIEPKKCRRFYLKKDPPIICRSSGEIIIRAEGRDKGEPMPEGSLGAKIYIDKEATSDTGLKLEKLSEGDSQLSKAEKWQEALERHERQSRTTTPFWRKPRFYIPTAAIAIGITAAVFYLAREAGVSIHIDMP